MSSLARYPTGAPSRRRLICVARVRKDSVSLKGMLIEPRKWVPHPSSAWVGEHEPNQLPCSVPNRCPIQATSYLCRSSEKRQRLAQRNANRTEKMGAPSKLRLGGRARTQSALLLGTQMGAPSRRRLICVARVRKDSVSLKGMLIEPRKWVPHPSSAWVGEHEPNQLPCSVPNMGAPSRRRLICVAR